MRHLTVANKSRKQDGTYSKWWPKIDGQTCTYRCGPGFADILVTWLLKYKIYWVWLFSPWQFTWPLNAGYHVFWSKLYHNSRNVVHALTNRPNFPWVAIPVTTFFPLRSTWIKIKKKKKNTYQARELIQLKWQQNIHFLNLQISLLRFKRCKTGCW